MADLDGDSDASQVYVAMRAIGVTCWVAVILLLVYDGLSQV